MGIYQRILDMETEVVKFHRNFIVRLQPIIDQTCKRLDTLQNIVSVKYDKSSKQNLAVIVLARKIQILREHQNEIIDYMGEFQKNFRLLKEDLSTDNMISIRSNVTRIQKEIFSVLNLFQDYFLTNSDIESSHSDIMDFIKKYQPSATELFKKTLKEINDDISIVNAAKPNFRTNFINFIGRSYIHKIESWEELEEASLKDKREHRKIFMRFTNQINFLKNNYSGLSKSYEESIKKGCNQIIEKYPEYEQRSLKIRGMNARQLEWKALEIIKNTFVEIIHAKPNLIRDTIKKINVNLVHNRRSGAYFTKSDFTEMYIEVSINKEVQYAIEVNQNSVSQKGIICETIIHELTHAYDWMGNTRPDTKEEFKKTENNILSEKGEEKNANKNSKKGTKLAEIITLTRNEGMARFAEATHSTYRIGPYNNINISLNCGVWADFLKLIHQEEILSKNISQTYNNTILHQIGEVMTKIIFLDKTRGKFLYSKKTNDIDIRTSSILADEDVQKMILGQTYILAAEPKVMEYEINNFIKKISLTPPELFLEWYETACANFHIQPMISKKDFVEAYEEETKRKTILDHIGGRVPKD